jgi:Caspase domain
MMRFGGPHRKTALLSVSLSVVCSPAFADCQDVLQEARDFASTISIHVESAPHPRVGEPIKISWRFGGSKRPHFPTYFVIITPVEVRFVGNGFLALAAQAKGPHGLGYAKDKSRAIAPLHREIDAVSGEIGVTLYRNGPQVISWAVVTAGACGEHSFDPADQMIDVSAGAPEIVVQDRFAVERPSRRIRSPLGTHEIRIFKDRYEVHDLITGAKILDRAGTDPNFSPTGRFVAARGESGIVDLASGRKIETQGIGQDFVAWAREDSYAIIGAVGWESLTIFNTLTDGRPPLLVGSRCGTCRALRDLTVILDVDDGYALGISDQWRLLDLVTGEIAPKNAEKYDKLKLNGPDSEEADKLFEAGNEEWVDSTKALRLIQGSYDPNLTELPDGWKLGQPLMLSHVTIGANKDEPKLQAESLVRHALISSSGAGRTERSSGDLRGHQQTSRGFEVNGAVVVPNTLIGLSNDTIANVAFDRLKDAGIPTRSLSALEKVLEVPKLVSQREAGLGKKVTDIISQIQRRISDNGKPVWDSTPEFNCGSIDDVTPSVVLSDLFGIWHWHQPSGDGWLLYTSCRDGTTHLRIGQLVLMREGTRNPAVNLGPALDFKDGQEQGDRWALGEGIRVFLVSDELLAIEFGGKVFLITIGIGTKLGSQISLVDSDILAELRLTADERHLVQVNGDGRVVFYRISDGIVVLNGVYINGEIVLASGEGFYDSTFDGSQDVQVRFPGIVCLHYFNQFDAVLRRPGLGLAILGGQAVQPASSPIVAPPISELTLEPAVANGHRIANVVASGEQELSFIQLYIDGRLSETRPVSGRRESVKFDISDPGGGRWVAAVAVDKRGLVSLPSAKKVPGAPRLRGIMRAVVIGVDSYADSRLHALKFASSDATRFEQVLRPSKGRSVRDVVVNKLINAEVTPQSILSTVAKAAIETGFEDTLVIFYAGHGVNGGAVAQPNVGFALTTPISQIDHLGTTAVSWGSLATAIAESRGTVIVVLDACHAGAAEDNALATNDDVVKTLTGKGRPIVVLAATKGRELSYEDPNAARGGVFTAAIVKAISEARENSKSSGLVDLSTLYAAVKVRVSKAEKGRQTPWLVRDALVGDMTLF